jgi:hypothetical protein
LDKGRDPLSEEEMHFIQMCCQIMKVSENEKVESISTTAVWEGKGNLGGARVSPSEGLASPLPDYMECE